MSSTFPRGGKSKPKRLHLLEKGVSSLQAEKVTELAPRFTSSTRKAAGCTQDVVDKPDGPLVSLPHVLNPFISSQRAFSTPQVKVACCNPENTSLGLGAETGGAGRRGEMVNSQGSLVAKSWQVQPASHSALPSSGLQTRSSNSVSPLVTSWT